MERAVRQQETKEGPAESRGQQETWKEEDALAETES